MKFNSRAIILLSLFSVLFSCGNSGNETVEKAEKAEVKPATLVEVVIASSGELNREIETTGTLLANESAGLSSEVGGIIKHIYFQEGSEVQKGELLLELNNQDLLAELKELEVQMNLAEKQYLRSKKLKQAKGISEELLEEREANWKAAKASVEKIKADLAKTKIIAPFSGIVGLRNHSAGDFLAAGTEITSVVDIDPLKVSFSLPEKYLQAFAPTDSIWFHTALSEKLQPARIYAINPSLDANSRTFTLKALFNNQDKIYKPGGFATVFCRLQHFKDAVTVPTQSIVPEKNSKYVFLVQNGKAVQQSIEAGIRIENQIQVIQGVEVGDTIVSSGLLQIQDGSPLQVRMDNNIPSKSAQAR